MEQLKMESLKNYTTIRIGGMAETLYIPESREELLCLLEELRGKNVRILGGGSNILMDDQVAYSHVIYMEKCDTDLKHKGDGLFYCGASVRLQRLILYINEKGYGGIEYLMSVPGMSGGAVVMNAGRGKKHNQTISDYIVEVEVWKDGAIEKLSKEECAFSHRSSIFKNSNMIVLGIVFQFPPEKQEVLKQRRKERLEYSRSCQDNGSFNFGSLFCTCNHIAMRLIKRLHLCRNGEISFSSKTSNWMLNKGDGTYRQAMAVIRKAVRLNRLFGTKPELEVIIWKEEGK